MEDNGGVVEVAENVDAEAVDHPMAEQQSGVDSKRSTGCGNEAFDFGEGGDEGCGTEGDARCDGYLAQEVEPAGYPGCKRRVFLGCEDGGPEVGASGGGDGGDNLCHAETNEHGEEGHDDPSHGHDARAAGEQAIFEQGGYSSDDGLEDTLGQRQGMG